MQAAGYVRVSKLDDRSTSPARQREAIERWCAERDHEVAAWFEDLDTSAYRNAPRPGLERLLGQLGEFDIVVGMRLDRIARSVTGFSKLLDHLEQAGVKLATCDGEIDTSTAAGRAMVQMKSVFAELESGTISERARAMHDHKRQRGEWVGRVPFGFKLNGKGLEPDPEKLAVLEDAARRYVAGESLRRIAADAGIHHPNLAQRLRSDRVLDALPAEVAGPLAAAMSERGRSGSKAKRSLLGGVARCSICGSGMTVSSKGRAYGCRESGHVYVAKEWLDSHVSQAIIDAIDTGKLLAAIKRRRKRPRAMASAEVEARLELLEFDHYETGLIGRDSYLRRREGLLKRLQSARDQESDRGIDLPAELARNLAKRWPELSIMGQRRIVSACLERIEVAKALSHGKIDPSRVTLVWRA